MVKGGEVGGSAGGSGGCTAEALEAVPLEAVSHCELAEAVAGHRGSGRAAQ